MLKFSYFREAAFLEYYSNIHHLQDGFHFTLLPIIKYFFRKKPLWIANAIKNLRRESHLTHETRGKIHKIKQNKRIRIRKDFCKYPKSLYPQVNQETLISPESPTKATVSLWDQNPTTYNSTSNSNSISYGLPLTQYEVYPTLLDNPLELVDHVDDTNEKGELIYIDNSWAGREASFLFLGQASLPHKSPSAACLITKTKMITIYLSPPTNRKKKV